MKFSIEKNILDNILISTNPFLEKKDMSNITSHIYIEVKDKFLLIKSTDQEIGLKITTNEIVDFSIGKGTVNGSNLLDIIKRLQNQIIKFEIIDNNIIIKQNRSKYKLPMYNADEYPSFPNEELENKLDINSLNLMESIKKITPAIDNNNPRYELNGTLIDIKNSKINFVATDTRRLAISNLENISNKESKIIIPKKAIIEIQKLFFDKMKISYNNTYLIIKNEKIQFFTKLINGKYPEYERIIPNSTKYNIKIPKDIFIESIKLVTSLSKNVKITFNKNSILFESIDSNSESKTKIDIDLEIEENKEFMMATNSKHILDFLNTSKNEKIDFGYNDFNLPFVLKDNRFLTIIMPITLQD